MNELLNKILESKKKERLRLASLPIEEKLILMERMRDRAKLIAASPLRTQRKVESKSGNGPSS